MPIPVFDEWASSRSQTLSLSALKGAVIGIHASHYLDLHLNHNLTKEPLLIALGGFPFALKAHIEKELQALKNAGITCVFVFDGLEIGKPEQDIAAQNQSTRALRQAWEYYDQQQADQVVDAFSTAGSAKPESLYKFLQRILFAEGIEFIVAPYAAAPQLAYLEKGPKQFIDAIFGPSDLFLFDVDKVITKLDTESFHFNWITRQACTNDLSHLTNDQFIEFCLLLGSPYLRTFPPFESHPFPGKALNIRDALNLFNNLGRNAIALCTQFEDDQRVHELQYLDRFKRAFVTLKHHIIIDVDGKVGPINPENAPSDLHELVGQRLPEELYFYMSKGIIGPNVPNWLTSGEIPVNLPLGAEESDVYRRLVSDMLTPARTQSICLLSNSLHRFYQTKAIHIRPWYDNKSDRIINLKTLPSVREVLIPWRLRQSQLPEKLRELQGSSPLITSSLTIAKDPDFVSKSFVAKDAPQLSTKAEILSNVMWRFLQLRGYIDDKHQLTAWGLALEKGLSCLNPYEQENLEEPTFLAVEMLRLGILNSKELFVNTSGGPMRGSAEERSFNLLISRVACFGKIRHKSIGYSGPLSRQLLSFHSLVYAIRSTLRDLIEVILAGLLLGGEADRERSDWSSLGLSLPFIDDNDCGLGIAMRTYLDDLPQQTDPTSASVRAEVKAKGKDWFQHSHSFVENLDIACHLWDAVYTVSQKAPTKDFKDAKVWSDTNKWLEERRAMMDDDLMEVLCPRRKEYPEHFRKEFLRRIRGGSVQPGMVCFVAVTDPGDDKDGGNAGKIVGYCVWKRRGSGPDARKWQKENEGAMNKIYARYYSLLKWAVDHFKLDKSVDPEMLAKYVSSTGDHFSSPIFSEMWYIAALAVDPVYQRRGIGKLLVKWGIEQARREKVPIGLEASPKGKGLYEKLGFRTVKVTEWMPGMTDPVMVWEPEGLSAEESWFARARKQAERASGGAKA
ncbi:hypothetical protein LOZ57_004459 [Ophidiomyces ophidiicola]|uniref:uncharacterized protein n=1 Tax=Ophidiomyces ophidiicola TaxID=1387563 RepID=UPI0020C2AF85|nr:uncharacterized protein LOZ57_004459 [Ophidiomyces ophidiicola]KAI1945161.1 hypothetical protein LOZ57_004459 [Ophidiomyces ophidiicola]KAI2051443.1 hypothetical protein LOZ43_004748 [Ophidiomyces ophidiicola]